MNIFFLDIDPEKCAKYHCDKHVVKMLLELVQLLYTAHHVLNSILPPDAYRLVSKSHPMAIWVRLNIHNYNYTVKLGKFLAKEYTHRYNKIHSCEKHINWLSENIPIFKNIEYKSTTILSSNTFFQSIGISQIPLAMPTDCMLKDTIHSYRKYYLIYKKRFTKWTNRPVPQWFSFIRRF